MSTAPTGEDWHDLLDLRSPTEDRNPRSGDIDLLGTTELVRLICAEDRVVVDAVAAVTAAVAAVVDLAVAAIRAGGRVHYVGSGTSGRLGVLDAVELLPTFGVGDEWFVAHLAGGAGAMMQAVEGAEDDRALGGHDAAGVRAGDLVFGIAASGRTPYVAGALAAGRSRGARTALLSANPHAVLAAEVDVAVLVDTGPEVVTGSTRMKAATAQKMVLNTFSTATLVRLGRTYSNLMIDVRATNAKLRARTVRMLVQATGLDAARCEAMLDAADQEVRTSLVALLAGTDPATARAALVAAAGPARDHDRSGVRTAVAALTEDAVPEDVVPGPAVRPGARVGCAHAEAPPRGPVR
ncbi:N-acetylmuramic acid 6-phosphate etherase [Cellulomonas hominis]